MTPTRNVGIVVQVMDKTARRVLLVEDDARVRGVLDRQLRALGWDVIAVGSGHEAIRLVQRGTRVEALLTDIDLPDTDGGAVAREVTRAVPEARIVFMSTGVSPVPRAPGRAGFLHKPFSFAALEAALTRP